MKRHFEMQDVLYVSLEGREEMEYKRNVLVDVEDDAADVPGEIEMCVDLGEGSLPRCLVQRLVWERWARKERTVSGVINEFSLY
jgi:hypothetical protein